MGKKKDQTARCVACGAEGMREEKRTVTYPVDLPFTVELVDATVRVCDACGEEEVSIPHMENLHRMLMQAVVRKPGRLPPQSIRYLRKWLGWSGVDFARVFETTPETVSRWENGKLEMNAQADILLRHIAETGEPIRDYALHDEEHAEEPMKFVSRGRDWAMAAK